MFISSALQCKGEEDRQPNLQQLLTNITRFVQMILTGPQTWAYRFPDAAGKRHSPVDINAAYTVYDEKLCFSPLNFKHKTEGYFEAVNTGSEH